MTSVPIAYKTKPRGKGKKTVVIGIFILIIYYTVIDDSDSDDVFDIKPTKKKGDTKMEMEN